MEKVTIKNFIEILLEEPKYIDVRVPRNKFDDFLQAIIDTNIPLPNEITRKVLNQPHRSESYRVQYLKNDKVEKIVITNRTTHQMQALYKIDRHWVSKGDVADFYKTEYYIT